MTLESMQVMVGYHQGWDLFAELMFVVAISIVIVFFALMIMFPDSPHKKYYR